MLPSAKALRALLLGSLFASLASCSEYLDRRDTITLGGGNAVATDKVTQMADPWPRASADRNIAYSGERMETAIERYRTNRVYQPQGIGTSASYQQQPQSATNNTAPVGPTVTQAAGPVK